MNQILAILTLALLPLLGCSAVSALPNLADREFLSTSVTENGADRPLVPGTRIRLSFTDGNIGLSASCNLIGGPYRIEGGRLVTDALSMTEMGCDPARHGQDDWVSTFIGSRPLISLAGNDLVLRTDTTVVTLLDREVAEPDLTLVGPTWQVTSIIAGDAVSSIPDGIVATLKFLPDGQLQIAAGCNQGSGSWVLEGQTLRVTDIVLTRMACTGAGAAVESAVLAVLESEAIAAEIDASMLSLSAGGQGVQLTGQ